MDTDAAGNIYFATFQQAAGELFTDMVIYKFSPSGQEIWHTRWGGKYADKAFVVTVAGQVVYVGGLTYSSATDLTTADMAVLALRADTGALIWDFTWGQGYGYEEVDGLKADGGSIYVSGWTTGSKTGNDVAILKLDHSGKLVWANTWGGPGWDEADGQLVVNSDSIYIAGRYNGAGLLLGGQGLLARFSKSTGEFQGDTVWGGPVFTDGFGLASDGTYLYVVGLTLDRGNGGQIFLRKYDKQWNLLWERLYGGKGSKSARAVAIDGEGGILVAGSTDSESRGGLDILLLRYNQAGDLVWAHTWGGAKSESAHGIALRGEIACIAGDTQSFGSGQDDAILILADARSGEFPASP